MTGTLYASTLPTKIGDLFLVADDFGALVRVTFLATRSEDEVRAEPPLLGRTIERADEPCAEAREELSAYFAHQRRSFNLDLAPEGTPFQLRVWRELARIPYGETITYGELARRVESPDASRAVGMANHVNPLPIVIPCHRVVGQGGALVGFGGGLSIQRALLDHERGQAVLWD